MGMKWMNNRQTNFCCGGAGKGGMEEGNFLQIPGEGKEEKR